MPPPPSGSLFASSTLIPLLFLAKNQGKRDFFSVETVPDPGFLGWKESLFGTTITFWIFSGVCNENPGKLVTLKRSQDGVPLFARFFHAHFYFSWFLSRQQKSPKPNRESERGKLFDSARCASHLFIMELIKNKLCAVAERMIRIQQRRKNLWWMIPLPPLSLSPDIKEQSLSEIYAKET